MTLRVMANSRKSRPTISPMNKRGMSTAIREMVNDTMVKPICSEPFRAACSGGSPSSRNRMIFSIMTMASSTTNPVEIVSAIKVRLFRLKPARYITPNVPTIESGTATLGMMVADTLRRNRKITMTTSATVSISSNSTSDTDARMVMVRSVSTSICTAAGRLLFNKGSSFVMRSTTWMMLAPGCR